MRVQGEGDSLAHALPLNRAISLSNLPMNSRPVGSTVSGPKSALSRRSAPHRPGGIPKRRTAAMGREVTRHDMSKEPDAEAIDDPEIWLD
jgi:hypothetical protein